ncbi:N-acetylmuramidase family protein [Hymenobacter cavernae]|uniref:N-acetylmuramidase domain-containing protein n=1 Tax=Hymenobacter cavernae TaxID=2044852 RepID=A0ABQ1UVB9_9BACT|nr:N-acetylmuramidase family protein [Hymenobacter cavernae]GGF26725.1 hypothetical protein GCM10011383_42820 [Hymenobacter cavernae]
MEYNVVLKSPFAKAAVIQQLTSTYGFGGLTRWGGWPTYSLASPSVSSLAFSGLKPTGNFSVQAQPVFENQDFVLFSKSSKGGQDVDYFDIDKQHLVYVRSVNFFYWEWPSTTGAPNKGITQEDLVQAAKDLGLEVEVMMAIARQESHGGGFFADGRPKILFERHKMYQHLRAEGHDPVALAKKYPDIVNKAQGGYGKESVQYDKLERARKLDEEAALESASWGRFQIMGENYKNLYATPQEMEKAMRESEKQQLAFFVAFLRKKAGGKLITALKNHQWETVALYYNGKFWKKINPQYANNLQKYYAEYKKKPAR